MFLGIRSVRCKPVNAFFTRSFKSSVPMLAASAPAQKSPYSYHWNFEHAFSVATPIAMGAAFFYGTPAVDVALGIILPVHIHMGFDQIIEDYVPARKFGFLNVLAVWGMRVCTALVLYGCYVINSKDVGLTALIKRLWTGKKE